MSAITTALAEVWGHFVEDATFTLAILACLIGTWLVAPVLGFAPAWRGALLFTLLAIALIENVWRSTR